MNLNLSIILLIAGLVIGGFAVGLSINATQDSQLFSILGYMLIFSSAFLMGAQIELMVRDLK